MKHIVFVGTPEFSKIILDGLLKEEDLTIDLVITGEDKRRSKNRLTPTPVKCLAQENGIEVLTPKDINYTDVIAQISSKKPDFVIVVAYGQYLKKAFRDQFTDRLINVHSSLLPKYRGAAPIQWAIVNGEHNTGVSIMLIDREMDAGDIINQKEVFITDSMHADELHDVLAEEGVKLLIETLKDYENFYRNRCKQENNKANYCPKITKEMGKINFNDNSNAIYNKLKGFTPWPGTFFIYENLPVKVHNMYTIHEYNDTIKNGTVVEVNDQGIKVKCADGFVVFTEIQFPNKKRMQVKDYLKGNSFPKNILLQ